MISGTVYEELTLELILSRISEYEIFRFYLGKDFKLGVPFKSPLHDDKTPSFSIIKTRSGRLHWTDWGGGQQNGKIIDLLRQPQFFPTKNYNELLKMIYSDLSLSDPNKRLIFNPKPIVQNEDIIKENETFFKLFQFTPRKFNIDELRYWNQYLLDIEDLKAGEVYAPSSIYINKKKIILDKNELVFCYLYDQKYVKVYRPFPKAGQYKFITNVPNHYVYRIKQCEPGMPIIPTKARKDLMVIRKVYNNVCETRSENCNVFDKETIDYLKTTFPRVFLNFDPDRAGMESMLFYLRNHDFGHIITPMKYRCAGVKDLAELTQYTGSLNAVKEVIKRKLRIHHENFRN